MKLVSRTVREAEEIIQNRLGGMMADGRGRAAAAR